MRSCKLEITTLSLKKCLGQNKVKSKCQILPMVTSPKLSPIYFQMEWQMLPKTDMVQNHQWKHGLGIYWKLTVDLPMILSSFWLWPTLSKKTAFALGNLYVNRCLVGTIHDEIKEKLQGGDEKPWEVYTALQAISKVANRCSVKKYWWHTPVYETLESDPIMLKCSTAFWPSVLLMVTGMNSMKNFLVMRKSWKKDDKEYVEESARDNCITNLEE